MAADAAGPQLGIPLCRAGGVELGREGSPFNAFCELAEALGEALTVPVAAAAVGAVLTFGIHMVLYLLLGMVLGRALPKLAGYAPAPAASVRQRSQEIRQSLAAIAIYSLVGAAIGLLVLYNLTQFVPDPAAVGLIERCIAFAALVLGHDTYFYWTHRLLHRPCLFRHVHHVHHRFRHPTVWSAYAFGLTEAGIHAAFVLVALVAVPADLIVLVAFLAFQVAMNMLGHSGVEIFPASWERHRLLRWLNSGTHHQDHHRFARGNYGLYLVFWDRWLGSEFKRAPQANGPPRRAGRPTG